MVEEDHTCPPNHGSLGGTTATMGVEGIHTPAESRMSPDIDGGIGLVDQRAVNRPFAPGLGSPKRLVENPFAVEIVDDVRRPHPCGSCI